MMKIGCGIPASSMNTIEEGINVRKELAAAIAIMVITLSTIVLYALCSDRKAFRYTRNGEVQGRFQTLKQCIRNEAIARRYTGSDGPNGPCKWQ